MNNERKRYFVKQKLLGLGMIILGAVMTFILDDATVCIFLIPIGLDLIFTKDLVLVNDYYWKENSRREKRTH